MTTPVQPPPEEILCPNCMLPNAPAAHFCKHCVAPRDTFASTDPVASIYSRFDTFGKASKNPRNAIILIGMWLILEVFLFLPLVGIIAFSSAFVKEFRDASAIAKNSIALLLSIAFGPIPLILLFRTTRNYFQNTPDTDTEEDADDDQQDDQTDITNDDDEPTPEEPEPPM